MLKKIFKIKNIYAILFILLMMLMSVSSFYQLIHNKFFVDVVDNDKNITKTDAVSFSQQYPFEENNIKSNNEYELSIDENKLCFIEDYYDLVSSITSKTNTYLTEHNPLLPQFNKIQNFLLYRNYNLYSIYICDSTSIVKLPNGYFTEVFDYCPSQKAYDSILDFSAWLEDEDIPYITLITPSKADDSVTVFPECLPHGYTQTLNDYIDFLNDNNLYYIESKQTLLSKNNDFYSWFYKTDHHWNVHAAFTMANETAKKLNDEFSITTDTTILDIKNFQLVVYPDSFLGSYGNKISDVTLKEDMEILYPKMATSFHIEIPSYGIDVTGNFDNTLIYGSLLSNDESSYSAFLYGDQPLIQIENNLCNNGTKILVIKYSFADSLCAYLANTVQYLDMIDPRHFDGSIRSYIKQTKPDAVILCMGVVTEGNEEYLLLK